MNDFRKQMGLRIRDCRKAMDLTQEDMAELLNISVKHYGGVERGNAGLSLEKMVTVSRVLNISLDYLVNNQPSVPVEIPPRLVEIYLSSSEEKRNRIMEIMEILNKC